MTCLAGGGEEVERGLPTSQSNVPSYTSHCLRLLFTSVVRSLAWCPRGGGCLQRALAVVGAAGGRDSSAQFTWGLCLLAFLSFVCLHLMGARQSGRGCAEP